MFITKTMKEPLFNVEERIDRIVGRRTNAPDALSVKTSKKADGLAEGIRGPACAARRLPISYAWAGGWMVMADDLTPESDL